MGRWLGREMTSRIGTGFAVDNLEPLIGCKRKGILSDTVLELWSKIVNEYTRCGLTRPIDKLVAISGLAQLFQEETGDQYLAGMWKSRLLECLNWAKASDNCWTIRRCAVMPSKARRYHEYISPSFSWAAFDGPTYQFSSDK